MVTHLFSPIREEAMLSVTRGSALSLCFERRECATTSVCYSLVHSAGKGEVAVKYQVAARSKIVCDVIAVMVHSRSLHPRKPNICLFPYRLRPTNLQNDRID